MIHPFLQLRRRLPTSGPYFVHRWTLPGTMITLLCVDRFAPPPVDGPYTKTAKRSDQRPGQTDFEPSPYGMPWLAALVVTWPQLVKLMPVKLRVLPLVALTACWFVGGLARSADPPREWLDPNGARGKLLICGGGKLPERILDRFWQSAGGAEARIVVVPTASRVVVDSTASGVIEFWRGRGVAGERFLRRFAPRGTAWT